MYFRYQRIFVERRKFHKNMGSLCLTITLKGARRPIEWNILLDVFSPLIPMETSLTVPDIQPIRYPSIEIPREGILLIYKQSYF